MSAPRRVEESGFDDIILVMDALCPVSVTQKNCETKFEQLNRTTLQAQEQRIFVVR
jgi:hypothetical protein